MQGGPGQRLVPPGAAVLAASRRLVLALLCSAALAGAALVGAGAPAAAQSLGTTPQILTLDQDRLYTDSLFGKAMEARALAASRVLAAENRQIEADLAAEEADLTKKRATMPAASFQTLADAFDAKVEKLRADQAAKADALKAERDAGRKTFFQAAVPVLGDLMHDIGALAILNHDAVVLSFDSIDVTDRAIKALDEKLGDGSNVPQGPRLPGPVQPAPTQPAPTQPAPTQPAPDQPAPDQPAPTPTAPQDAVPPAP